MQNLLPELNLYIRRNVRKDPLFPGVKKHLNGKERGKITHNSYNPTASILWILTNLFPHFKGGIFDLFHHITFKFAVGEH